MENWQNGKLTKWQADKIEIDKMAIWKNGNLSKRQVNLLTKCQIEKVT